MKAEIDSLEANYTWDLQELRPNKTLIGSQWVFRVKFNADGTIERCKSRVVALRNHQKKGLDYKDMFSPVAKMTTVRLILDIAETMKF